MSPAPVDRTNFKLSPLEAVVLEYSRLWYRDEDSVVDTVVEQLRINNGELFGVRVGEASVSDSRAAYERLWSNRMLTRVTPHVASQIVRERLTSVGHADIALDDVAGLLIFTEAGLVEWFKWFDRYSDWLEEDSTRWFFRGTGVFSLSGYCTAMKDNPQSYRCCQLGCRLEKIGPWAQLQLFVMPSGWRLICNRRADGN